MKKEVEQVKEKSFFDFPNKFNVIFIFIFLLLYIFVLAIVLVYVVPKPGYTLVPDYKHITEYNEDMNVYLKASKTINSTVENEETKISEVYSVVIYPVSNSSVRIAKAESKISALTSEETMQYFADQTDASISSTSHFLISSQSVDGNNFKAFFGKIKYLMDTSLESQKVEKTKEFKEEVIKLAKKELKSNKFTNQSQFDGKFKFSISMSYSDDTKKRCSVLTTVSFDTTKPKGHLDYQAFYVTKDNEIIPFLGWYNVASTKITNNVISNTNYFPKEIDVEYIYVKANYYLDGNVTKVLYRVSTASLLK